MSLFRVCQYPSAEQSFAVVRAQGRRGRVCRVSAGNCGARPAAWRESNGDRLPDAVPIRADSGGLSRRDLVREDYAGRCAGDRGKPSGRQRVRGASASAAGRAALVGRARGAQNRARGAQKTQPQAAKRNACFARPTPDISTAALGAASPRLTPPLRSCLSVPSAS